MEGQSVTDLLLSERIRIDSSHQKADQVIEMAYTARESLYHQRSTMYGSSGKLGYLSSMSCLCPCSTLLSFAFVMFRL